MQFHAAISDSESTENALESLIASAEDATGGKIDVAFVFLSEHHREQALEIAEQLWLELDLQCLVGCSAEGVIGGDKEIERAPGLALMVASMPGVRIHPFHIGLEQSRAILDDEEALIERVGYGQETRAIIGFGDPFTTDVHRLLPALDRACPNAPLIGGMASAGRQRNHNVLFRNDEVLREGIIGVSLSGPIEMETVVSQGCRPVGTPMVITKARQNVIEQLSGKPALQAFHDMFTSLPASERHLLENGLLIGRVINEYQERFGRGDFLVRNLVGADQQSGAIAIGDLVRVGQTVQFHARDAATADEDLALLLDMQRLIPPPAGGLLFSCNGRGTNMFDQPCHDITAARRALPTVPMAGFFAAGEFGPVGGKNFIHGHTASLALFRPRA